jgi:hypothetical protein
MIGDLTLDPTRPYAASEKSLVVQVRAVRRPYADLTRTTVDRMLDVRQNRRSAWVFSPPLPRPYAPGTPLGGYRSALRSRQLPPIIPPRWRAGGETYARRARPWRAGAGRRHRRGIQFCPRRAWVAAAGCRRGRRSAGSAFHTSAGAAAVTAPGGRPPVFGDRYRIAERLQRDILRVRCPGRNCQAPPGEGCRGAGGIGVHTLRVAAAFKAEFSAVRGPAYGPGGEPAPPMPGGRGWRRKAVA